MTAARFGLIGSPYSESLCLIKKAAEDRGIKSKFISPLAFPRYALSITSSKNLQLDQIDLLDFDCFYIDLFEQRRGFFRGYFDKQIWVSLQKRYEDFANEEVDNKAYQMAFLLTLGNIKPCINSPQTLLATRLRPPTLIRLRNAGIPVADFRVVDSHVNQPECRSQADSLRIRLEEESCYDVPCFPRELVNCPRIEITTGERSWQAVCVIDYLCKSAIEKEGIAQSRVTQPDNMRTISQSVLSTLELDMAWIEFGRFGGELKVLDVNPFPNIALFEEVTKEPVSQAIIDRMLGRSGKK